MPSYLTPGLYIEERKSAIQPIEAVSTSTAAFIGVTVKGPVNKPTLITSVPEFVRIFGGPIPVTAGQEHYLYYSVRHFFNEGGNKCRVVRVMGYADVNDAASIQGVSASLAFNAVQIDGATAVAPAFKVSALTPGRWGEALQVGVENASKFSVLLAENVVGAAGLTQLTLRDNQDVQVGSLLHLVEQMTGVVKSVDATTTSISLQPGFTAEPAGSTPTYTVANNTPVFSPDMKFVSVATPGASVTINMPVASVTIQLSSLLNVRGESLKAGDVLNFIIGGSAMVVVKRITDKLVAGERAMVVEFDAATLPNFDRQRTKVYARDFDVIVKDAGAIAESHEHLTLIDTNRRDYINERLAPDSGASQLIKAEETAGAQGAIVANTASANLTAGNDGLAGVPAFGPDDVIGSELTATGLFALDSVKDISILVIPNAANAVAKAAIAYCERRKDLFFVMDLPSGSSDPVAFVADKGSSYAAIYYPWIFDDDPITGKPLLLPPSGAVAGTYANTDITRGVHKAPAGVNEGYLNSATAIQRIVTKAETDVLYQQKVNVIRKFPEGILVWGARTLATEPAFKYVNVRRLFIFLEKSIERGLQWVVFEPNDYSLWKSVKRNVEAFLRVQWEEAKLVGATEDKAFFVRCDEVTNTPDTVSVGQLIAEIGVAPSTPAEFVVFRFKQFVGKAN